MLRNFYFGSEFLRFEVLGMNENLRCEVLVRGWLYWLRRVDRAEEAVHGIMGANCAE